MAETIKGINVVIGSDTTALTKSLSDVNKKSRDISSELKQVEKLLKLDPGNTELLEQKQKLLADAVANTSDKLSSLKTAQEQVNEQFSKGEINEAQYRAFNREIAKTEQELQGFENQLKQTTPELKKMADETESVSEKLEKMGDKTTKVGKGMSVGLTAPIVAVGAAGIAAFNDVDEALDTIITKTGATGEAAEGLTDSFNEVASRVPDDLGSVGEAIGEVNTQFGFLGKELEDNSQLMLQFANINGTDVTSSSIAAKKAIEAYGMANGDLGIVLDAVTKTAQDTGQAVDFLFDKAVEGAPQIKALGLSFEEGTALIGGFEKAGVDSSAALSSLSKAQVVFAKDGKTMEQGLDSTIKAILGAKNETEALTEAAKVFGTKGAVRMVDAIKRGTFNLEDFASASENAAGAVVNTFNETVDPIDEAAVAANNAKLAMAEIGEAIQVALLPAMEAASKILKSLADWFRSLSPETKNVILVFAGIAAAIGPVLVVIGSLMTFIAPLIAAIGAAGGVTAILGTAFAALTGPIGLIIGAVVALVAGLIYLFNTNETVRDAIVAVWEFIKSSAEAIFTAIKDFWATWGDDIISFFTSMWEGVKEVFNTVIEIISELIKTIFEGIKEFWDKWGADIMAFFETTWGVLKTIFETVFKIIFDTLKFIFDEIKAFWDKWGDTIVEMFKKYFELLKIVWSTVFDVIFTVIKTIFKNIKSFWDTWGETILVVFKTVFEIVKSVFKGVWDQIKIIVETAIGIISGIIELFLSILKGDWKGAWDAIKGIAESVWDGIKNTFGNVGETMMEIGKNIIRGLINGIKSMKDAVVNTAKDIASSIGNSVKDFFTIKSPSRLMLGYGKNIVQGLANGMENTSGKAVTQAVNVAGSIADALQSGVANASVSASVSGNSGSSNSLGNNPISGFGGITVQNMVVREESDIRKIARELYVLQQQNARGRGIMA